MQKRYMKISLPIALLLLSVSTAFAISAPSPQQVASSTTVSERAASSQPDRLQLTKKMGSSTATSTTRTKRTFKKRKGFFAKLFKPKGKPKRPVIGDRMAIASLVLGIVGALGVFLFFPAGLIMSILALIFGIISRKKFKDGLHDRGGMALAGLILGIVFCALAVLFLILLIALFAVGF